MTSKAFLEVNQAHIEAIKETKIAPSILTLELFPETCQYIVFRKNRNLIGGGVMLLFNKDIPHMLSTELENKLESFWAKNICK